MAHRGLLSVTSLTVTIVLGRTLDADGFGIFAVLLSVLALTKVIYNCYITEPALVYGPSEFSGRDRGYLWLLYRYHWRSSLFLAVLTGLGAIVAWLNEQPEFAGGLLVLAVAMASLLLAELHERVFFMWVRPLIPAAAAMAQLVATVTALGLLLLFAVTTVPTAVGALLVGSLAANGLYVLFTRRVKDHSMSAIDRADVWSRHSSYGSWAIAAHLLFFAQINIYPLVIPTLHGFAETAVFRAQAAMTGPFVQSFGALGVILVPLLRRTSSPAEFSRVLRFTLLLTALVGGLGVVAVGLFGDPVLAFVYGGRYSLSGPGYWLAGLYSLGVGLSFLLGSALVALDRPADRTRVNFWSALASVPIGLLLVGQFGAEGAIAAQALSAFFLSVGAARSLHIAARITSAASSKEVRDPR